MNFFKLNLRQKVLFILTIGIIMLVGCKKDDELVEPAEEVVEENTALEGDTTIVEEDTNTTHAIEIIEVFNASLNSVNFSNESIHFTAKLNQEVTAHLILTGKQSGAIYDVYITDSIVDLTWKGGHTGVIFFDKEEVSVEFTVLESDISVSQTITIEETTDFDLGDYSGNGFEFTSIISGQGSWWFNSAVCTINDNSVKAIEGEQYLKLEGESSSTSVYVGGASLGFWTQEPMTLISGQEISSNPDNVWFNVYVYGTGDSNTELYITMFEDEGVLYGAKTTDDGLQVKIVPDHTGWKLFSYKYADIPFKTFNATTGNNTREPHRIVLWDIALQTKEAGQKGKVMLDLPIMTVGGPFDPSKY